MQRVGIMYVHTYWFNVNKCYYVIIIFVSAGLGKIFNFSTIFDLLEIDSVSDTMNLDRGLSSYRN